MQATYEDTSAHIAEIRQAYERSTKYLGTVNYEVSKEDIDKIMASEQEQILGLVMESLDKANQQRAINLQQELMKEIGTPEEIMEREAMEKQQRLNKINSQIETLRKRTNGGRQITVSSEFVEEYLDEGFEFVTIIGNKAIMRLLD